MKYNLYLKKSKDESLRRFHPWVFSGAVARIDGQPEEGDLVRVLTSDGEFIAVGHWQIGSIVVRVLSFEDIAIDQAYWAHRLQVALDVRRSIGVAQSPRSAQSDACLSKNSQSPNSQLSNSQLSNSQLSNGQFNNTYRLVHGEGDNLPGLIIDVYGRTAVMQAHSVGMHVCRKDIAQALKQVMGDELENIYYKSETTLPFKAGLGQQNEFLLGGSADNIAVENGLKFHIDWLKGQKTGFFVDQRDNRALVEHYAQGRNVLNMFCYTGGFSVYAMRGGARLVHSVDSSAKAVELVNANMQLNFPGDPRHTAFAEDAFRFLDQITPPQPSPAGEGALKSQSPLISSNTNYLSPSPAGEGWGGVTYDLVILDPPAFAKHKDALRHALKGYTKLNARAMEKMPPGSILFTFSCSQAVSKEQFRMAVFTAAALARRRVRILHQLHQPADHPINIYHPEGEYLKGLVLYVE